jgi:AraC-like DNA-binding protein
MPGAEDRNTPTLRAEPTKTFLPALLAKLIGDAADALDRDKESTRDLLRQAVALLQSDANRRQSAAVFSSARPTLAQWKAKRVTDYIDANLDRPLPLRELAKLVQLSNSYFSRAFKMTFEKSPHAFIMCRRVERARQQMLKSKEPLSQIAVACGFADQAHLARLFRREMGSAPSQWRRVNLHDGNGGKVIHAYFGEKLVVALASSTTELDRAPCSEKMLR